MTNTLLFPIISVVIVFFLFLNDFLLEYRLLYDVNEPVYIHSFIPYDNYQIKNKNSNNINNDNNNQTNAMPSLSHILHQKYISFFNITNNPIYNSIHHKKLINNQPLLLQNLSSLYNVYFDMYDNLFHLVTIKYRKNYTVSYYRKPANIYIDGVMDQKRLIHDDIDWQISFELNLNVYPIKYIIKRNMMLFVFQNQSMETNDHWIRYYDEYTTNKGLNYQDYRLPPFYSWKLESLTLINDTIIVYSITNDVYKFRTYNIASNCSSSNGPRYLPIKDTFLSKVIGVKESKLFSDSKKFGIICLSYHCRKHKNRVKCAHSIERYNGSKWNHEEIISTPHFHHSVAAYEHYKYPNFLFVNNINRTAIVTGFYITTVDFLRSYHPIEIVGTDTGLLIFTHGTMDNNIMVLVDSSGIMLVLELDESPLSRIRWKVLLETNIPLKHRQLKLLDLKLVTNNYGKFICMILEKGVVVSMELFNNQTNSIIETSYSPISIDNSGLLSFDYVGADLFSSNSVFWITLIGVSACVLWLNTLNRMQRQVEEAQEIVQRAQQHVREQIPQQRNEFREMAEDMANALQRIQEVQERIAQLEHNN